MGGDEIRTPPDGTPLFSSTPEARMLFNLGVALNCIAVDLSVLAQGVAPDFSRVLSEASKRVADAEILVHDARRALRAMAQVKKEEA